MRSAAGGEAASVSITPNAMIASTAPSAQRSTVHHHCPIRLRSSRGTWIMPPSPRSRRPAGRAPSRGTHRRDARSSSTGPTRRRPATAAPPRARSPRPARARARRSSADCRSPQRSNGSLPSSWPANSSVASPIRKAWRMRSNYGCERRHAALLRLAADDPVDVAIGRQRARRGVGIGRLAVVDVDRPCPTPRPAPGGAAGRDRSAGPSTISSRDDPEPAAGRPGAGGVLGVVVARQGRHIGEVGEEAVGIDQLAGAERDARRRSAARAPPARRRSDCAGRAARPRRTRRANIRRRRRSRRSRPRAGGRRCASWPST